MDRAGGSSRALNDKEQAYTCQGVWSCAAGHDKDASGGCNVTVLLSLVYHRFIRRRLGRMLLELCKWRMGVTELHLGVVHLKERHQQRD